MNWKNLITDLVASGMTQVQIAEKAGCRQASISDLYTGKTSQPSYAIGAALVAMHKKAVRQLSKQAA